MICDGNHSNTSSFQDLNKEQLKIGLFSGNVVLKDLEVKGEALDSFNLPVTVKKGKLSGY